jgi:hypothetical protein
MAYETEHILGIRETLEKKKPLVTGLSTAVIIAAAVFMGWYLYPRHQKPAGTESYFTDDDGTTWFVDDAKKLPPFTHDGKEAVLAKMYRTDDGKLFVGYLEKFTDEGKAKAESSKAAPPTRSHIHTVKAGAVESSGLLVKKPHEGTWVPEEDPAATAIRTVTSPDGNKNFLPLTP